MKEIEVSNDWKMGSKKFQSLENAKEKFPIIGNVNVGWKWPVFALVALLFLVSGGSALLYQVVWTKRLVLVFGGSGYAVATTLAVFMLGLALGSRAGGIWADRMGRPLLWYALVEAGIAFSAYASNGLLNGLQGAVGQLRFLPPDGVWFVLFRLAGVAVILLVPTVLMGMTFPILIRQSVLAGGAPGRRAGWLYGLNTVGGVAGSLLAGFWLIGLVGVSGALMAGVVLNAGVALLALLLSFAVGRGAVDGAVLKAADETSGEEVAMCGERRRRYGMLTAFFCAGFASLGVECVWMRMLLFHLNSTAQAFAAMLAVVLLCMGAGSLVGACRVDRCKDVAARYGVLLLCAALGMLASLAVWSNLAADKSFSRLSAILFDRSFMSWQLPVWDFLLRILVPSVVLTALPAFLLGMAFPYAAACFTRVEEKAGRHFGGAYMLNTLGCMLGPLFCGFVVLPQVGMQGALLFCAAVLVGAGCVVRVCTRLMPLWQGVAVVVLFAVIAGGVPDRVLGSLFADRAIYYDDAVLEQQGVVIGHEGSNRIIFHEEDVGGSVLVMEQKVPGAGLHLRRLYVGPTSMITDNFAAQRYTKLIGHLPVFLADKPRRALVICLGTGMTLSGVAAHEELEQIDCAELSPAVTRAVHCYDHVNGRVLEDPRVNLMVKDGRTHLLMTQQKYDVIALEPPPPDNEGAANLYSREFYELCLERMNEGGALAQWIPFHLLTFEQVQSLMVSMLDVFPQVSLWEIYPGVEFCLIGHKTTERVRYERLGEKMREEGVQASLDSIGITHTADLLNGFVADTDGVRRLASEAIPVTDDCPSVGYCLENLGLLTEQNPQEHALRSSMLAYDRQAALTNFVDFAEPQALEAFVEAYIPVRSAWLMDRKLSVVALLGVDAFLDQFGEDQLLMAPSELDAKNPLYRTRPRVTTYIRAYNRLAAHYERTSELTRAMQCRMAIDRLRLLLPESYYAGAKYSAL